MFDHLQLIGDDGRLSRSVTEAGSSLLAGFRKLSQPTYAVMDGACFFDLPKLLEDQGIRCRSLFLEHPDAEITRAAGWFVPIENEDMLSALLALPKAEHAMVLWSSDGGEDRLFRHLRSINVILIPEDGPAPGIDGEEEAGSVDLLGEQSVMFRHYDPEVIDGIFPLLTQEQFIRMIGSADQIMWYSTEHGTRRRALKPRTDTVAPRGALQLTAHQIEELEANRRDAIHAKVARFLRQTNSERTSRMSDAELYRYSNGVIADGEDLGLRSERSLTLWTYMQFKSDGKIGRDPGLRGYLRTYPEDGTPDDKIYALMTRLSKLPDWQQEGRG